MNLPRIPRVSDHGSEIMLFAMIAAGITGLIIYSVNKNQLDKLDVAACLLVLQGIVSAVKERWTQRSVDRMGQQLGQSAPPSDGPTGEPGDPVNVKPVKG